MSSISESVTDVLVERVADLQLAQREMDVAAFVGLFEPGAIWVSAFGVRLVGRTAIAEFTAKTLPGAFVDGSVRFDVSRVTVVSADVAITSVDQEYLDVAGFPLTPRQQGRPTYVWRRSVEGWFIVHGQNTQVAV